MPQEGSSPSTHEIRIFRFLRSAEAWFTNREVHAALREHVSDRTIRMYTKRLALIGLLDVVPIFPEYRYRWSAAAAKRARSYLARLEQAETVLVESGVLPPRSR